MNYHKNNSGFSLVTTLFILVVLAILGSYMALMGISQNQTTALSVQGVRAWYSAVSGFEWAADRISTTSVCPTVPTVMSIQGFTVTLTGCTTYNITEGASSYNLYDISVLSERGSFGEADYVSRTLRATFGGP
ncbi:MAG: pilus assembly protein MshP [Gammaproteobacteria bacterium]|nr:pilus assembly protein MshP [Gammaproteobacteria bacterium]